MARTTSSPDRVGASSPPSSPPALSADDAASFCAIDFGTSNSAIAISEITAGVEGMRLVELEPEHTTMPTAVFHLAELPRRGEPRSFYGRAAVDAYVDGLDGRLMRSLKSVLGSDLIERNTDIGGGRAMKFVDIIADYLRHLKTTAEQQHGAPLRQVVLGRPVFFVDGDPVRDAKAERSLESAARSVGFQQVAFQYEPIAAALDYERTVQSEQIVLVADIGGGTSDFSVVRVGPQRLGRLERKDDILANHGVHVAGTDFDRSIELASVLPEFGYRATGPVKEAGTPPREVPSAVYFDLATWHLINTVYSPGRVAELRAMKAFYGNPLHHRRLMMVVDERLGHDLAARAEEAKIDVAAGGETMIDLSIVEPGLQLEVTERDASAAVNTDVDRIVAAGIEAVRKAGLEPRQVDAVYFTGGSTGLRMLADRIAAAFPDARAVTGDRFSSVAAGLGLYASRLYGKQAPAASLKSASQLPAPAQRRGRPR